MAIFSEEKLIDNILTRKLNLDNTSTDEINLLCCVNDNYVNPMINLMFSIRHFCDKKIHLYVHSTGLTELNQEIIKEKMKYLAIDVAIQIIDIPQYKIDFCDDWWTLDCYLKVFAFLNLPKKLKKVICLDADMLCLNDITPLNKIELGNKMIGAVIDDNFCKEVNIKHFVRLNIDYEYFNCGMLVL